MENKILELKIKIRKFKISDSVELVNILKENRQYSSSAVEGPEAMLRVSKCSAAIFLVAETGKKPVGLIKAVYEGSRALIHLLSVHPEYQRKGIGKKLVAAVIDEFKKRGAPTISVTTTNHSTEFWKSLFFHELPVKLMLRDIEL